MINSHFPSLRTFGVAYLVWNKNKFPFKSHKAKVVTWPSCNSVPWHSSLRIYKFTSRVVTQRCNIFELLQAGFVSYLRFVPLWHKVISSDFLCTFPVFPLHDWKHIWTDSHSESSHPALLFLFFHFFYSYSFFGLQY